MAAEYALMLGVFCMGALYYSPQISAAINRIGNLIATGTGHSPVSYSRATDAAPCPDRTTRASIRMRRTDPAGQHNSWNGLNG
jgi:hypothetical protein